MQGCVAFCSPYIQVHTCKWLRWSADPKSEVLTRLSGVRMVPGMMEKQQDVLGVELREARHLHPAGSLLPACRWPVSLQGLGLPPAPAGPVRSGTSWLAHLCSSCWQQVPEPAAAASVEYACRPCVSSCDCRLGNTPSLLGPDLLWEVALYGA